MPIERLPRLAERDRQLLQAIARWAVLSTVQRRTLQQHTLLLHPVRTRVYREQATVSPLQMGLRHRRHGGTELGPGASSDFLDFLIATFDQYNSSRSVRILTMLQRWNTSVLFRVCGTCRQAERGQVRDEPLAAGRSCRRCQTSRCCFPHAFREVPNPTGRPGHTELTAPARGLGYRDTLRLSLSRSPCWSAARSSAASVVGVPSHWFGKLRQARRRQLSAKS